MAEASRAFDLSPSEIEGWVEDAKRGMENALRANLLEIREQYEKQLKDLQAAYGAAMLEVRARKKLAALMERGEPLSAIDGVDGSRSRHRDVPHWVLSH